MQPYELDQMMEALSALKWVSEFDGYYELTRRGRDELLGNPFQGGRVTRSKNS